MSLRKRLLDISFRHKLSHLGSCLTAVDIIDSIYFEMQQNAGSKFVLSSGHAGLALYCVLEKYGFVDAEAAFLHHGVHPDRCEKCHIDCSSGSLGHGLPIAVGMALADRRRCIYCLVSDGECAEGSIWEALNIFEQLRLENLFLHVNLNGWAAYKAVDINHLGAMIECHLPRMRRNVFLHTTNVEQYPFLRGNDAHYYVMNEGDYESTLR